MFTVQCKNCGNYYESKVNRSGICPDCKINVRGRTNTKYREKTYDRLTLYVPKGNREILKEYVAENGMSVNEFINNAIELYMQKIEEDKQKKNEDNDIVNEEEFPF